MLKHLILLNVFTLFTALLLSVSAETLPSEALPAESIHAEIITAPTIETTLFTEPSLLGDMHKTGKGKMSFMFWDLYNAELYSATSQYVSNTFPIALKLTYLRNIKSEDFIDATNDQWNKLRKKDKSITINKQLQQKWITQLTGIFPNIKNNDTILLVVNKNKESHFYVSTLEKSNPNSSVNYLPIGSIKSSEFSTFFLNIWLSQYTTEPKLRQQLIGKPQ